MIKRQYDDDELEKKTCIPVCDDCCFFDVQVNYCEKLGEETLPHYYCEYFIRTN